MDVLLLGVAALLTLCFAVGWVMLLTLPLITLSGAAVVGVVKGVVHARAALPALSRGAVRGILCIEGLVSEPELAKRLRSDIARVLKLAAPDTRPRACACVKESEGAFVGVMRVFNSKGHYLRRAAGTTAAAVAMGFSAALGEFEDAFPARGGARRVQCPECDPRTCPLRRSKRERALAAA